MDDLHRLGRFVKSLEASTDISIPIKRLHRTSQVLYEVARFSHEKRIQGQMNVTNMTSHLNLEQGTLGPGFLFPEEIIVDSSQGIQALVYSQLDECYFGPQQVLGSLQLPF